MAEKAFFPTAWGKNDIPAQLQDLLPNGYSYKLKKWIPMNESPGHFEAFLLVNVYTEHEAQEWWHEFNVKSNTTMRVKATCPKTGKINVFKIYLRCLHQGRLQKPDRPEKQRKTITLLKRNTGCPAGMIIAIRRIIKYSRSKKHDPVDPIHPCEVQIRFVHNHPIDSPDSLRFRPVSKEAEEKLLSLYQIGHSPASALETLKMDLQIEHGEEYSHVASDRYHCPDRSYCYRLYYKHFGKEYASTTKKDLDATLNTRVLQYNVDLGEQCVAICKSGNDFAIAICTPLMKRAHTLQQSGDIIYVQYSESPGNKERGEHHVFLLLAHTAAGGVPLGAIITTNSSTQILISGFQLLKQLLPQQAFYGRGVLGPQVFFIEESDSQRIALHHVWSDSDIILCIFRILQSLWQWLWDDKHNIHKDHRLYLLYLVKTLLYASSEAEMAHKYQVLYEDKVIVHYPQYLQQAECLWQRRHYWGVCFHKLVPLQGANNYYEAAVRALKDQAFEQTKAFNIIQLVNFIITRLEAYYKSKLLSIACGKVTYILRCHYPNTVPASVASGIRQVAGNYFLVPNDQASEKLCTVDAELNACTCSVGITGAFCRHQYWVFLKFPTSMLMVNYIDENFKKELSTIAEGSLEFLNTDSADSDLTKISGLSKSNVSAIPEDINPATSVNEIMDYEKQSEPLSTGSSLSSSADCAFSCSSVDVSNHSSPASVQEENGKTQQSDTALKKVSDIAAKFEKFCQLVKDGLKNHPEDFVPAVDIMMKNLERKGNSSDSIIAGMSFFGVPAGLHPSYSSKEKKKPTLVIQPVEEVVPLIHGRQMITYGKRRNIGDSVSDHSSSGKIFKVLPDVNSELRTATGVHEIKTHSFSMQ